MNRVDQMKKKKYNKKVLNYLQKKILIMEMLLLNME